MSRFPGYLVLGIAIATCVVGVIGTVIALDNLNRGNPGLFMAFLVVDLIGFGLVFLGITLVNRGQAQERIAIANDPVRAPYPPNETVRRDLDGVPYTTTYVPPTKGKNSRPSTFTIATAIDCPYEFEMVVEKWFDTFCKRLGIAVEVQTGDEKFDEQCYIRSDCPAFTSAYLADAVKRIAILDLRRFGFLTVTLKDQKLSAQWIGFDPKIHHEDDLVENVAARLLLLARDLPIHEPEFERRTGTHRVLWQVVLWIMLLGFGLTIFSLTVFTPTHTGDLILRAVPVLLLGWPAFAYITALLLSGTSRSHLAWGALMTGSLFLIPLGSAGSVGLLNGLLDRSAAETRDANVVEKYTTRSKNKTHYRVRVQSWRDPGGTESFQISSSEYQSVVPNRSKLQIVTYSGGLGIEWIQSQRVIP